uniref:Uncharacterized protein n=1 Tax=Magallana gigas TaxID=29159 RepID=K1Q4E6_MAGGI
MHDYDAQIEDYRDCIVQKNLQPRDVILNSEKNINFNRRELEEMATHTTVKPDYNAILHQLGEYFKGRDLHTRQLVPVAGDSDVARDDILHELGEYWKGRIAALSALLSQHSTQQHINLFSQLLNNLK